MANEPTKAMLKRMAGVAPDRMIEELEAIRRDRDALKQAVAIRIVDYLKMLSLQSNDVLILRPPPNTKVSTESLAEIAVAVADRLRVRAGWEGVLLVEAGAIMAKMTPEQEKKLYEELKKRHGD